MNMLSCRLQGKKELLKKLEKEILSKGFCPTYKDNSDGCTGRLYFNISFEDFLSLIDLQKKLRAGKQQDEKEISYCDWTEEEIIELANKYNYDSDFELFHKSSTKQSFIYSQLLKKFLQKVKNLDYSKDSCLLLREIRFILEVLEKHDLIGKLGYQREYYNYKKEEWRSQHEASLGEAFLEIAIRYLRKEAIGLLDEYIRKFVGEPDRYLSLNKDKSTYRLEKYRKILESIDNCFNVIVDNYPVDKLDLKELEC